MRMEPMLLLLVLLTTQSAAAASEGQQHPWKYDVFLSFRGLDVRHSFVDHLHHALARKGVTAFNDELDLPRGQNITEAIPRAIQDSRFYVVVLSKGYASSPWCLDELVKIVHQCRDDGKKGQAVVVPVFYHLSPADVSDPSSGCYKSDFDRHKRSFTDGRVKSWRRALASIAVVAGWVLPKHGSQAQLVEEIATKMLWKIQPVGGRTDHGIGWKRISVAKRAAQGPGSGRTESTGQCSGRAY